MLSALMVASCAPSAAEQAEICAIFAQPGVPGETRYGDAAAMARATGREHALYASGAIYGPGWQVMGHGRSWGRCPSRAPTIDHLLISRDGLHAMTKGGRRAHGRPVTFGTCFYDKTQDGWRLTACRAGFDP